MSIPATIKNMRSAGASPEVGLDLYHSTRASFARRGESLHGWCAQHGIHHQNAKSCLLGAWDGPKARELRKRIIHASRGGV